MKLTRVCTACSTAGYVALEAGIDTRPEASVSPNVIDIRVLGCIAHEMLARTLPFRGFGELRPYCLYPGRERHITAKETLDSEWLRYGRLGKSKDWTGPALRERPTFLGGGIAKDDFCDLLGCSPVPSGKMKPQGKGHPDTPSTIEGMPNVFRRKDGGHRDRRGLAPAMGVESLGKGHQGNSALSTPWRMRLRPDIQMSP